MAGLSGTNPITGDSVDASDPKTIGSYVVGGMVVVGALMAGRWAAGLASDATGIGDTVEERVLNLT